MGQIFPNYLFFLIFVKTRASLNEYIIIKLIILLSKNKVLLSEIVIIKPKVSYNKASAK